MMTHIKLGIFVTWIILLKMIINIKKENIFDTIWTELGLTIYRLLVHFVHFDTISVRYCVMGNWTRRFIRWIVFFGNSGNAYHINGFSCLFRFRLLQYFIFKAHTFSMQSYENNCTKVIGIHTFINIML